ncbi:MAG: hypothetical protein OEW15_18480 [Nitrospirota bacterium]|nr:hypothetical protein [Nitrospirota bacterium]
MRKWFLPVIALFTGILIAQSPVLAAGTSACEKKDTACQAFAKLAEAEQYDRIIETADPKKTYSAESRKIIGQAYLMIAGRETNTPEQEEQFCLKALEYGATSAYMGLYFIHAGTNAEKALGYLKQYVATKPMDSVPYVILGEAELEKNNYAAANTYLVEARRVARGKSGNLDWLLFQASYLNGDYATSAQMLDSSFSQGKTIGDLKSLIASDPRFSDVGKRAEFKKFMSIINNTTVARAQIRP